MLVLKARRLKRPATNYNLWVYQSSTAEEDTAMHAWFGQNFQATENYPAWKKKDESLTMMIVICMLLDFNELASCHTCSFFQN